MKKLKREKQCSKIKSVKNENGNKLNLQNKCLEKIANDNSISIVGNNRNNKIIENKISFIQLDEPYDINEINSNILKKTKRKAKSLNKLSSFSNLWKNNSDIILKNPNHLSHSFIRLPQQTNSKGIDICDFFKNTSTSLKRFLQSAKLTESMHELSKSHKQLKSKSRERIRTSIIKYGTIPDNNYKTNTQINFHYTTFYIDHKENSSMTHKTTNSNLNCNDLHLSENSIYNPYNHSASNTKQSIKSLHLKKPRNEISSVIPEEKIDYFLTEFNNLPEKNQSNIKFEDYPSKEIREDVLSARKIEENNKKSEDEKNLKNSNIDLHENIKDYTCYKLSSRSFGEKMNKTQESFNHLDRLIDYSTMSKNKDISKYYLDEICLSENEFEATEEFVEDKKKFFKEIAEYKTNLKPEIQYINCIRSLSISRDNKIINAKNDLKFSVDSSTKHVIKLKGNNCSLNDYKYDIDNSFNSNSVAYKDSSQNDESNMHKENYLSNNNKLQIEKVNKEFNSQRNEIQKFINAKSNKNIKLETFINENQLSKQSVEHSYISNKILKNFNDPVKKNQVKNGSVCESITKISCYCFDDQQIPHNDSSSLSVLSEFKLEEPENYKFEIPSKYQPNFKEIKLNSEEITKDGRIFRVYSDKMIEIISTSKNITRLFPDGYSITYFNNGDIKQTYDKTSTIIYYARNQSVTFNLSSNSCKIYKFRNNQLEKHFFDGRIFIK